MTNLLVEYFLYSPQTAPKRWSFFAFKFRQDFFRRFLESSPPSYREETTARMSRNHVTHAVEVTLCRTYKYTFH